MRSDLLDQKERGDHLSSLIPNRPRGLFTTTASRRRAKMPCLSQPESSRLTVNSVVAVICANFLPRKVDFQRAIHTPAYLRKQPNQLTSQAWRNPFRGYLSKSAFEAFANVVPGYASCCAAGGGNRSDRASNVGAFQTSALHVRRVSAVEQCLPRCADPTDPTI